MNQSETSDRRKTLSYLGSAVMVIGVLLIVSNFVARDWLLVRGQVVQEGMTPLGGEVVRVGAGIFIIGLGFVIRRIAAGPGPNAGQD